tara:strand:- start:2118 stop:2387 length:270 start_codon:yes stop_codon:yes gene_type:complete
MKVSLEIGEETLSLLVPALLKAAKREGLVVPSEERDDPLSAEEASRRSGLSSQSIRRLVQEGELKRIPGTSRLLVTKESWNAWRKGGSK